MGAALFPTSITYSHRRVASSNASNQVGSCGSPVVVLLRYLASAKERHDVKSSHGAVGGTSSALARVPWRVVYAGRQIVCRCYGSSGCTLAHSPTRRSTLLMQPCLDYCACMGWSGPWGLNSRLRNSLGTSRPAVWPKVPTIVWESQHILQSASFKPGISMRTGPWQQARLPILNRIQVASSRESAEGQRRSGSKAVANDTQPVCLHETLSSQQTCRGKLLVCWLQHSLRVPAKRRP
jgi:hypothetical protein